MRASCFLFFSLAFFLSNELSAQYYDDSLAVDAKLRRISQGEFMNAILLETSRKDDKSPDILESLGLTVQSKCDEICDTYLVEKGKGKQLLLPSDFDQGVIDLKPSPNNGRFLIYSSYDGPDYTSFYTYRAEIIIYDISEGTGLKAIRERKQLHLYDWSIEDLIWLDNNTIVIKAYSGSKSIKGVDGGYSYFKLKI